MGLNIGQVTSSLGSMTVPRGLRGARPSPIQGLPGTAKDEPNSAGPFFQSKTSEVPQIGFGEGTVSGPALALVTLGRGVRAARRTIPSIQEIREDQRAKLSELRAQTEEEVRERESERVNPFRPEPTDPVQDLIDGPAADAVQGFVSGQAAQAQDFLGDLDDAAAMPVATTTGAGEAEDASRDTSQAAGQAFAFGTRLNDTQVFTFTEPVDAPSVDILV